MKAISANFDFLSAHDAQLVRLGALAERYFKEDPNTCLIKLRQFGEVLAQLTAAKSGLLASPEEPQADLLRRLKFERIVPREVGDLFHQLRIAGNRATHDRVEDHAEALTTLKIARELGIWFHRTFADRRFSPGAFVPPPDPAAATKALQEELDRLRQVLNETATKAEKARVAAEAEARERMSIQERARKDRDDRAVWEQLASEAENAKAALAAELQALQAAAVQAPSQTTATIVAQAEAAAAEINIDEASTRTLIDVQLRTRGWEVDTPTMRFSTGTRPSKGRNVAIAEWPTKSGPADYALFIGTQCIGVVEAKRRNKNVSSHIDQAQRYARGFRFDGGAEPVGGPWPDSAKEKFFVPFVFSTNGRPYLRQIETESGIWFRDTRKPFNHRRALSDWPTPDGLKGMLEIDAEAAQVDLKTRPFDFGFPLRPYQKRAIETVEAELAEERRTMLLAMATGTGKTKLAIAMLYRLLAAKRFRRVAFIVDRNALGSQAAGEFATTRIVSAKTFADIFGLKGLDTVTPDSETKVHICTIQGLVQRVLYTEDPADVPPVDQYDLMVVDECHRGYLLDREMSDAELSFRSQDDYISKYRRVLEHFDAVKIGLTATPALHTVSIFGDPVFKYSYREAVIDGYLIDHEPPVQITTALSKAGIKFAKNEEIELIDPRTGKIDLTRTPDEIKFAVDEFNKNVVTVPFNKAVAEELSLCDLLNGRAFKPTDWTATGLPIVRIQNLNNHEAVFNRFDGEVRSRFLIDSGALLFAWSGTPGTSFGAHIWNGGPAVLNQHIFNVIFDEKKIDKRFFRFAINQKLGELIDKAHGGVGLRHVTKGKFEATEIDLPPLAEQHRIVAKLDSSLSYSKRAWEELARLPRLVERYKQAILAAAFRGETTTEWRSNNLRQSVRPEITRIEEERRKLFLGSDGDAEAYSPPERHPTVNPFNVPDTWLWLRAEAVCDFITKGTTPPAAAMTSSIGDVPYIKVYNLTFDASLNFKVDPTFISNDTHNKELQRSRVYPDDVLINIVGPPLGKVSLVPDLWPEWNINQAIAVFRSVPSVNRRFLAFWFLSEQVLNWAISRSKATAGQSNLTLQICRDMPVPVCSVDEQQQIVQRIDNAFIAIDRAAAEASRATELLDRLDQATLSKAFRGDLTPPEKKSSDSQAPSCSAGNFLTAAKRSH